MNPQLIIDSLKSLLLASHKVCFNNQTIEASLIIDSQEKIVNIQSFFNGDNIAIEQDGATIRQKNSASIVIGAEIDYILVLRKTNYHFASYQSYITNCLLDRNLDGSVITIYEEFYQSTIGNSNLSYQPYLVKIINFIHLLEKKYYISNNLEQIVIFAKSYCEISVETREYKKYLAIVELFNSEPAIFNYFEKIIDWLEASPNSDNEATKKSLLIHETERFMILATEIYELVIDIDKKERIFHLLKNVESIYKAVIRKYSLYLNDFNYAKFNEKFTKFTNDFLEKVNKNISELQTQVLAIPMASAILATFKPNSTLNWVIFLAFFIYSLMVLYSTFQQFYNLNSLKIQMDDFKKSNITQDSVLEERWNKETTPIFNKIKWHKFYMIFIMLFVITIAIICAYNLADSFQF